jgi:choline dehydrogenase-like flavoprotein
MSFVVGIYESVPAVITALQTVVATGLTVVGAFSILLGYQYTLNGQYNWPDDYLTRLLPTYSPYPSYSMFSLKFWTIVPNNACMRTKHFDPKYPSVSKMEYDYIVVGSGPGGSAVAARLSENASIKVLLVEAGQDPIVESSVPQLFPFQLHNSRAWNYSAEAVNSSSNAYRNGTDLTAGYMLGGSSGTNAMIYVCGTDRDYDSWASLGNTGWDYNSLLQYIKKHEGNTNNATVQYKNGAYHGTTGPVGVSDYRSTDPFIQNIKDAFTQLGYKNLRDWNSKEYNGLFETQGTIKGGERMSSARAYLLPIRNRPNLTVMKGSLVEKVLFTGSKANGVNIVTKNPDCLNIKVYARKEVILSAGALGTPKILLKSGIGKPADLTPFGITSIKNLPVGDNFQDHPKSVHFIKINPNAVNQNILNIMYDAAEFYFNRTGKFSNLNVMNYMALINSTDANATYPNAHYIFYRFEKSQELFSDIISRLGYKQEFIDQLISINQNYQILMVFNHLPNPYSRGTVKLRSSNVWDYPKIVTNWFQDSRDVDTLLSGYVKVEEIVNTQAFQNASAELIKFTIPECDPIPYPSDEYRRCYIKYFTASGWHQSSTVKMGPSTDPTAVVDPRLRVHGIQGLRVADVSITPNVVTPNTQCTAYVIGEKAADMIKQDNP